jgi:CRISPR system Cascade subunit CasB
MRPKERIEPFLAHLQKRSQERGMMADLRHGFSPTTEYRAWPHIARWCHNFQSDKERTILLTIGAGFALHGKTAANGNMGATLKKLAGGLPTFDARFRRLLTCTSAVELCEHLVGVLRTAKSKGITVDFAQLYEDLVFWGEHKKVAWASTYWGVEEEGES